MFVMLEHCLSLIEKSPVFKGGYKVSDRLSLNADGGTEDVIPNGEHAGYNDHAAAVEEGWKRTTELTDVDNHARRFYCCSEAASTRYTRVHCSKKLFLGIIGPFAIQCKGDGHVLTHN